MQQYETSFLQKAHFCCRFPFHPLRLVIAPSLWIRAHFRGDVEHPVGELSSTPTRARTAATG
eukprot:6024147-Pleurochrysis_carterae.AAC.1